MEDPDPRGQSDVFALAPVVAGPSSETAFSMEVVVCGLSVWPPILRLLLLLDGGRIGTGPWGNTRCWLPPSVWAHPLAGRCAWLPGPDHRLFVEVYGLGGLGSAQRHLLAHIPS